MGFGARRIVPGGSGHSVFSKGSHRTIVQIYELRFVIFDLSPFSRLCKNPCFENRKSEIVIRKSKILLLTFFFQLAQLAHEARALDPEKCKIPAKNDPGHHISKIKMAQHHRAPPTAASVCSSSRRCCLRSSR